MATDEEIREEAEIIHFALDCKIPIPILESAIKKGIQMEQERIREQVEEDAISSELSDDEIITIRKIDIWADVK